MRYQREKYAHPLEFTTDPGTTRLLASGLDRAKRPQPGSGKLVFLFYFCLTNRNIHTHQMSAIPLKTRRPIRVLVADDDADDRQMIQEALEESFLSPSLYVVENGEQLLNYLLRKGIYANPDLSPRPGLILLDLNMPFMDGMKALQRIKGDPELAEIPVVILTTSQSPDDIAKAYRLGSNSFITKPVSFTGLLHAIRSLGQYWFDVVELPR